jgi:hypothetical protein
VRAVTGWYKIVAIVFVFCMQYVYKHVSSLVMGRDLVRMKGEKCVVSGGVVYYTSTL